MSTYLGYDVLELNYNRLGSIEERSRRGFLLLDYGTGKRVADAHHAAPAPARPFTWTAVGREEIAAMRAFLDARVGRAVPFWLPSYQWDLALAEDLLETATIATIRWIRYRELMFGVTGARRHLALWDIGNGVFDYYQVSDATDPRDGETETLTLDPVATRLYTVGTCVISFLKLCRLEEDLVEISYPSTGVAEATITVRELPMEAPI